MPGGRISTYQGTEPTAIHVANATEVKNDLFGGAQDLFDHIAEGLRLLAEGNPTMAGQNGDAVGHMTFYLQIHWQLLTTIERSSRSLTRSWELWQAMRV